jgi:two-component system, LytTR family, response regulator
LSANRPKINALIVDDEHSGRTSLKILLSRGFGLMFNKISTSSTLDDAINKAILNVYDLIFLDIELKGHSGFELLPHLKSGTKVIFVTAYSEFAIMAIKQQAFDYILKPINPIELKECMSRFQKEISNSQTVKYLTIRKSGESLPISLDEIEFIRADGPYSHIFTENKMQHTTARTLKDLKKILGHGFIRIHKSYLVNRNMIKSYKKDMLTTINNTCLPVSRVGSKELLQVF